MRRSPARSRRRADRRHRSRGGGRTAAGPGPGRSLDVRVEDDQEVVAQAVVLGQSSHLPCSFPRPGATSATGSSSMSIQRMRGSRRNHRSWRTANWRVRVMIVSIAVVERAAAVEVVEQLLVAERLASGSRRSGAARERSTSSTQSGRRSCAARGRRCARSAPARGQRRPNCANRRRRVRVDARAERAERPAAAERHLEGAHDAAAVGRLHLRRGERVETAELRVQRSTPSSRRGARARHARRATRPGISIGSVTRAGTGRCRPQAPHADRGRRCPRSAVGRRRRSRRR